MVHRTSGRRERRNGIIQTFETKEINMANSIAIDGPAGAGKSTIAKIVSKKL